MSFFSHGFISSGILNLTPREAYTEATENNAILQMSVKKDSQDIKTLTSRR